MLITVKVLAEQVQSREGKEYISVTGLETGSAPMLQLLDFGLRDADVQHKGKLVGKEVSFHVESVRALFSGRPQLVAKVVEVKKG